MQISKVVLRNWKRYRGEHVLNVGAGVVAVVARFEGDDERSNWGGKTSLFMAARFALYGSHGADTEDDWITRDEKEGAVMVVLDDGSIIERTRKRGKSTVVTATIGQKHATGEAAQHAIVEHVGLSEEDFCATCFLGQKQMSRLVVARPAERMAVVGAWLGLDPLQRCEERARLGLSRVTVDLAKLSAERDAIGKQIDLVCDEVGAASQSVDAIITTLETIATEAEAEARALALEARGHEETRRLLARAAQYDRVVQEGKTLRAELEAADPDAARAALEKCRAEVAACTEQAKQASNRCAETKALAAGQFDGRCPVTRGACPAAEAVRAQMAGNETLVAAAARSYQDALKTLDGARGRIDRADALVNRLARLEARLEMLRREAKELRPDADRAKGLAPPDDELVVRAQSAATRQAGAEQRLKRLRQMVVEYDRLGEEVAVLARETVTHREALAVFGRNGAQRQIAEAALGSIEAGANNLLAGCGIELRVGVCWSRAAATGLATVCDKCGAVYPASQKIKRCERCGADRGPKLVEKLEIELSDRSGAAEDLAGIALQLSAASWLRTQRGSQWSQAFIDEPFGALDVHGARALSTHLATMLGGQFASVLVVTHDRNISDALPGRIEIVAGKAGSRFA